ncbi:MAG: T9SS type A sorting domain-containing protein [Flavobacteriales bacterium]|nr:T9SS type A sorting domain-containing protein [Flavobacteriales bacterium]
MEPKNKPNPAQVMAMDRRKFLRAGSLMSLGSLLLPSRLAALPEAPDDGGGCAPTTDDILGPYYLAGSPNTTMVAQTDEPGTRLFLTGTVLSNDCLTPVPNAKIEVWQANDAAVYDLSPAFTLRGTMFSDANGLYAFETIIPGAYLNGSQYRPKHIHFKVTKPGFPDLVTQLYFEGDPYIAADPWASQPDAVLRIIPLNDIGGGQSEGMFDIVLDGFTSIKPNRYGLDGDVLPIYPNPMLDRASIHFNVFRKAKVQVIITDADGTEIVTLKDEEMAQGRYTVQWNGSGGGYGGAVAAGLYLVHLRMDDNTIKSQRIVRQ